MFKIKSADGGELSIPREIMLNNKYIKGTIIEKEFNKGFNELFLFYLFDEIKCLVELIREGIIYVNDARFLDFLIVDKNCPLAKGMDKMNTKYKLEPHEITKSINLLYFIY